MILLARDRSSGLGHTSARSPSPGWPGKPWPGALDTALAEIGYVHAYMQATGDRHHPCDGVHQPGTPLGR